MDLKKILFTRKALIYLVVTVLFLILWPLISAIIKWLAIAYVIYRVVMLALRGFTCPKCWMHLVLALIILLLSFIISSGIFMVIVVLLIWMDFFLGETK
jgi:hypothetical protein